MLPKRLASLKKIRGREVLNIHWGFFGKLVCHASVPAEITKLGLTNIPGNCPPMSKN
jgi:hypothetical protein